MNTQALQRATITVQRIIPAKAQGKSASVKDIDGIFYGVWPDKLALFREGGTYAVAYSENVKNGVTFRDISSVTETAAPRQSGGYAPQDDERFTASPRSAPAQNAAPAAQAGSNGNYYRPTAPRDSERMFVCSTLNAFIQTGRIDAHREHLAATINELRAAYAATFGRDDPQ